VTLPQPFHAGPAGTLAVQVAPRPSRRRSSGPPPAPPDDHGGGGDGRDGGDGFAAPSDAGGLGPFALVLALGGITTLFLVLIAVWLFLRRPAPDWRAALGTGALEALWISTACLATSSATVELAARRARRGRRGATRRWMLASLLLGAAFLAAQVHLWLALWRAGLVPGASGYAAVFFALTGLHALHVLGGLAFLGAMAVRLPAGEEPVGGLGVRLGAVYWHFMGGLWLLLFTLLYFVR
jgi:heme/copper-type cytochrome/quinol oxidase subunit 3